MQYRNQEAHLISQSPGLDGVYSQIEQAGRTCYNSLSKIVWDEAHTRSLSAEAFTNSLIKSKHLSVCEHGTIYLEIPLEHEEVVNTFLANKHSISRILRKSSYVTTNYRVLLEMPEGQRYMINYMTSQNEPTEYHTQRATLSLITDRGISAELCRHRVFSISERSTRYVKSTDMQVIIPEDYRSGVIPSASQWTINHMLDNDGVTPRSKNPEALLWQHSMLNAEADYRALIERGLKPQLARRVLPLSLLTQIVITASIPEWLRFLALREYNATGPAHPDMQTLAHLIDSELTKRGLISEKDRTRLETNPQSFI